MRKVTCVTPNACTVLRALMLAMLTAIYSPHSGYAEQPPPPCHPHPNAVADRAAVASRGDIHFLIEKQVVLGRTVTAVRPLTQRERVDEIARMSGAAPLTVVDSRCFVTVAATSAGNKFYRLRQ